MIRKLSHGEIVSRQIPLSREARLPLVALLENMRSLNNVGSVFRTADAVGLERLYLCGATGYPPQGGILKTSLGAEESVPWEYHRDALPVIDALKTKGWQILVLEQAHGAISVNDMVPDRPTCLVVGSETAGVSQEVCALADAAVEIRMHGVKNSLNAAVAFGVAVYALRRKIEQTP